MSGCVDDLNFAEQTNTVPTIAMVAKNDSTFICKLRLKHLYFCTSRRTPFVFFIRMQESDFHWQRSSEGIWNAPIVRNEEDCTPRMHIVFRRNASINYSVQRTHVWITPGLNLFTSGFRAHASSAVISTSRVFAGSMIASTHSRAAPYRGSACAS